MTFEELHQIATANGLSTDPATSRTVELHGPENTLNGLYDAILVRANLAAWQPSQIWQRLSQHLTANGFAYLEFDAPPAAELDAILRDIAHLHSKQPSPEALTELIEFLRFLEGNGMHPAYRAYCRERRERLEAADPQDMLLQIWNPRQVFSFADVEAAAARNGFACTFSDPEPTNPAWVIVHRQKPATTTVTAEAAANAEYLSIDYPEYFHARISPERAAAAAFLFGLNPVSPRRCRVLELGCGTGLSLLTFAAASPQSQFLGIDFSAGMIAQAKSSAESHRLQNIEFEALDIMDFGPDRGQFDYIIAHGIYSWVPAAVKDQVMRICKQNLSPDGVAYVSFNANPGYRISSMLREAGLWAARGESTLLGRSTQALSFVDKMKTGKLSEPLRQLVNLRIKHLLEGAALQAGFDEFGDINQPITFESFAQDADVHGLRYFSEAMAGDWSVQAFPSAAQSLLFQFQTDPVRRMAYRDCIRFATFHAALVCHREKCPAAAILPDRAMKMLISSRCKPQSESPNPRSFSPEEFESIDGAQVKLSDPFMKAALLALYMERPRRISLHELMSRAALLIPGIPAQTEHQVLRWLVTFWETGFLDLFLSPAPAASTSGVFPFAFPFAREFAHRTLKLPNLIASSSVTLDDEGDRELLGLLDGTRDLDELKRLTNLSDDVLEQRLVLFAQMGLLLP